MDNSEVKLDGAYALAILYTLGYLMIVGALMFFEIPTNNRELLINLVGIMSAAQLGIVKFFYDGTRVAQQAQQANIIRSGKADTVMQDIVKGTMPAVKSEAPVNGTNGKETS